MVERLVRNEEVRGSTPLGSTSLRLNEVKTKAAAPKRSAGGPEPNFAKKPRLGKPAEVWSKFNSGECGWA